MADIQVLAYREINKLFAKNEKLIKNAITGKQTFDISVDDVAERILSENEEMQEWVSALYLDFRAKETFLRRELEDES